MTEDGSGIQEVQRLILGARRFWAQVDRPKWPKWLELERGSIW